MRNDQFFVLMLVILLPMSGCFDGGVGDAEAADDTDEVTTVYHYNNTTIINHHHYNNTSTTNNYSNETFVRDTPELISMGGMADPEENVRNVNHYIVGTINSSSGEMVSIVEATPVTNLVFDSTSIQMYLYSDCGEYTYTTNLAQVLATDMRITDSGSTYVAPFNLPGSSFDCQHYIMVSAYQDWSLVYSVQNVTVV
jgi:hypothetical protein